MRMRVGMLAALATLTVGVCLWMNTSSAVAVGPDSVSSGAALVGAMLPAQDTKYEYVGSNKCKKCHLAEYKSWEETKMGKAFETLKPGAAADLKQKHGVDAEKDYTTDKACLACHTTGYEHPGGYAVPDASDKKAVKAAEKLEGVGCESCHGPGSAYIEVFEEIFKSKRKYKVEELYAVGLAKIDVASCTTCHNEKSPTFDASKPFDFEKMKEEGTHVRTELKQRED